MGGAAERCVQAVARQIGFDFGLTGRGFRADNRMAGCERDEAYPQNEKRG